MDLRHVTSGNCARTQIGVARLVVSAMLVLLTISNIAPASAASRHAAMVIDGNTGETLYAEQADEPRFPASLTKMMTLYMVFEMLETGRLTPATRLKVSQEAASAQPTKLDLEPGEQIAVMDAIKALVTKSANDMAIVLAEAVAGSESRFAEQMTQKARAIGMRGTTFRNASGLPDSGQVTTARDMLTLALRLQDDFPKYYPLFATRSFTYNGATMRNHNTMLGAFEGIDGIKTGYTRMSGFNLVTSMRRGDKHLVAAVFGGATAGTRNATMRLILTRALLKASTKKTRKAAPILVARVKPVAKTEKAAAAPLPRPKAPPATVARASPTATPPAVVPASTRIAAAAPETVPTVTEQQPAIEIAKVRPVMVALRTRPTAPSSDDGRAATPTPRSDEANTAPSNITTLLRQLPQVHDQMELPVSAPALVAQPIVSPPTPGLVVQRGAPPSSLQAQAQSLTRPGGVPTTTVVRQQLAFQQAPAAPARLRGPDALVTPTTGSLAVTAGFHIQIGAFASAAEADRVLRDAQARAGGLLNTAKPVTAAVQKENRTLYRARFAGFDAKSAASTCLELRRAAIDCFVMKGD